MTGAFPVFIGIVGKRFFAKDQREASIFEDRVRARLSAIFDHVETVAPTSPKILLTGVAIGADLIAAQEILLTRSDGSTRQNWLILAALPFEEALFSQDFTPSQWSTYRAVIADARVRRWTLPPLMMKSGTPAQASDLSREGEPTEDQKELRRRHYEQVGLWIAETANVFIAVMPADENPEKVGGTARLVSWRRGNRPDTIATEVVRASSVLIPRPNLLRLPAAYVWLVDFTVEVKDRSFPATVLLPTQGHTNDLRSSRTFPSDAKRLRRSKSVLDMARRYEADAWKYDKNSAGSRSLVAWPTQHDPSGVLQDVTDKLRGSGNRAAARSRYTFYGLATLFLVAVLAFEIFAKFLPKEPLALTIYIGVVVVTIGLYFKARWDEWQPIAEDRRAIREVLRVQRAWWQAGLHTRVDHVYLQGADQDLARVREAARNVVVWAQLTCPDCRPTIKWKSVIDPDDRPAFHDRMEIAAHPRDWVGSQMYYYRLREVQREAKGQLVDALSWSLFVTAGCLAVLLLAWLINHKLYPQENFARASSAGGLGLLAAIGCAVLCWWLRAYVRHTKEIHQEILWTIALALPSAVALWMAIHWMAGIAAGPDLLEQLTILISVVFSFGWYWLKDVLPNQNASHRGPSVFGLGAIVLLVLIVTAFAARIAGYNAETTTKYAAVIMIVFLPAVAGAIRFVAEKLAVEAEGLSYRDAHSWFERANQRLTCVRPGYDGAEADERSREIVEALGMLALRESEDWLKSRRERPLSPVIGG